MRDFIGLESILDASAKLALIEFSFNLTLGKLDEAYRAVKLIESASIWENMAQVLFYFALHCDCLLCTFLPVYDI